MAEPRTVKTIVPVGGGNLRGKSLNDIYSQRDRIIDAANGNRSRIERAMAVSGRYVENIRATEQYALDQRPQSVRVAEAVAEARRRGYTTAAQANADRELVERYGTFQNDFFGNYLAGVYIPERLRLYGRRYNRNIYARRVSQQP